MNSPRIRAIVFVLVIGLVHPIVLLAADRPNIVWINCEDLDETLRCYGDEFAITPNLDALAEDGILYRNAFANAPICAPARNCLITGMYPSSLGGQHLRCEIELPDDVKPFPIYLKEAGYFVSNFAKTDYNFDPSGIYDYWKRDLAPWRNRKTDQPFFSFIVFGTTHEGPGNFRDRYDRSTAELPESMRHDPAKAKVPPYFPDTPKMREIWARYYDLVSAMDQQVGEVIGALKEDGLWEDTIVWFYSDHGHGLPRHKRWLLDSGLRVPLIVRVPDKFKHLTGGLKAGAETDQLVSFVDFAPTVLSQAGVDIPDHIQGRPFLGNELGESRRVIYGARDRADDMFEVSRAVHDGRYVYVRHFLPHLPYLQAGRIFFASPGSGKQKESLSELFRARDAGELDDVSSYIFSRRKPVEELYDLENDPFEIQNLAGDPKQKDRLVEMRGLMREWVLEHRDTGFLHEAEYHLRAMKADKSIREMAQDPELYDLPTIFDAATRATSDATVAELVGMLKHADSGVRFWGAIGFLTKEGVEVDDASMEALRNVLDDPSPSVQIAAAEALCVNDDAKHGLPVLETQIASEHPWVALQAARAMLDIGIVAKPSSERIESVRKSLEATSGGRRYRDFNYASFTG